jgi:predicted XRE-type DNA-binding protein
VTPNEIQATADRLLKAHGLIASHEESKALADERRDLIRTLVEQAGWSQMQVAHYLGITHQRVSQLLATTTKETTS